jgi:hypothetical protein
MTPELTKEIVVGIAAVFFTALVTCVPAALLFWWTWRRDQERLHVSVTYKTKSWTDGKYVLAVDNFGPAPGILVKNRSLFPVYLDAAGFTIDGTLIKLQSLNLPIKTTMLYNGLGNGRAIPDESQDPSEILPQRSIHIEPRNATARTAIVGALDVASKRLGVPAQKILAGSKVVAIVLLESGREFTSEPYPQRLWRRALQIMSQMDGRERAS